MWSRLDVGESCWLVAFLAFCLTPQDFSGDGPQRLPSLAARCGKGLGGSLSLPPFGMAFIPSLFCLCVKPLSSLVSPRNNWLSRWAGGEGSNGEGRAAQGGWGAVCGFSCRLSTNSFASLLNSHSVVADASNTWDFLGFWGANWLFFFYWLPSL